MSLPLGFLDIFGFQGFIILAIIGVLLYGERLPEVAASLGKQLIQLKKNFQGIREEIESSVRGTTDSATRAIERTQYSPVEEATAPKFEPPPAEESSAELPAADATITTEVAAVHASKA